ncbi:DUF6498-containing protein [Halobellus clavatus]|uniref:Uncharacterized protein n=1 Tax=Halobellus clavatus TaxID=660517 RepID=A0A1H3HHQ1_9EURY|nr:DUF6498-containing protein [Halobellus clavatus]SDY14870.1 hypothetical protein SAMN04487946_10782 [Halobellus clavatus]
MRRHSPKWVVERVPGVLRESRDFVSGIVLNLGLIIGVVVFRWSLVEIALIYLIEVAIINLLFFSVALFTPQPVADLDGDAWDTEPTPLQPIGLLPPVYWRNLKFVAGKTVGSGVFIGAVLLPVASRAGLASNPPLSLGLAIAGIVLFQLTRIWRYFVTDRSYQDKSPADAMEFAFTPVIELYLIFMYVIAPVTLALAGIAFTTDVNLDAWPVLLLYLIPIGAIRAWIGCLDPQTDDLEISFS